MPERFRHFLFALALVALVLAPLLVALDRQPPRHHMEGLALLTARETWLRMHDVTGEPAPWARKNDHAARDLRGSDAWLLPTQNGQPRVRKPPMHVWLCMTAWEPLWYLGISTPLDFSPTAPPQSLILRARLVSVFSALLLAFSTWWIARTIIWERRRPTVHAYTQTDSSSVEFPTAGMATPPAAAFLIAGLLPLTQSQGRMASYDMPMTAFATLAAAAIIAFFAGSAASAGSIMRSITHVLLAAIALATAWLIKGPVALAVFVVPVGLSAAMMRDADGKRKFWRRCATIIITTTVAAAMIAPWFIYLHQREPEAWKTLWHEYGASLTNAQPLYYYPLQLLKDALPWSLHVIAGLALGVALIRKQSARSPLRAGGRGVGEDAHSTLLPKSMATHATLPFLWFGLLLIAFSFSPGKSERYILPIIPPLALLAASVVSRSQRAATVRERLRDVEFRATTHVTTVDASTSRGRIPLPDIGQFFIMCVVSAMLPMYIVGADGFSKAGWMDEAGFRSPQLRWSSWPWMLAALAPLALCILGLTMRGRARSFRHELIAAAWTCTMGCVVWSLLGFRPSHGDRQAQAAAMRVKSVVGSSTLAYLREGESSQPEYEFLFYMGHIVPPILAKQLADDRLTPAQRPEFIIARESALGAGDLRAAGYTVIHSFRTNDDGNYQLWNAQ